MKVTIRPLEEADAFTSVKWRQDPEIWKFTPARGRDPANLETELAWAKYQRPDAMRFAILADGQYVGNAYLYDIDDFTAEFHIFIGERSLWGQGIGKEATRLTLQEGRKIGLQSINLGVHHQNAAARKIYERLGFRLICRKGDYVRMSLAVERLGDGKGEDNSLA